MSTTTTTVELELDEHPAQLSASPTEAGDPVTTGTHPPSTSITSTFIDVNNLEAGSATSTSGGTHTTSPQAAESLLMSIASCSNSASTTNSWVPKLLQGYGFWQAALALLTALILFFIQWLYLSWTAKKDFIELCLSLQNAHHALPPKCMSALNGVIPLPPFTRLSLVKRVLYQKGLSWPWRKPSPLTISFISNCTFFWVDLFHASRHTRHILDIIVRATIFNIIRFSVSLTVRFIMHSPVLFSEWARYGSLVATWIGTFLLFLSFTMGKSENPWHIAPKWLIWFSWSTGVIAGIQ